MSSIFDAAVGRPRHLDPPVHRRRRGRHARRRAGGCSTSPEPGGIGNAIVPYYGEAAGAALTRYLKEHILIAVDPVAAAKEGNTARFNSFDRKWTRNARRIANFLSSSNPYWSKKDVMDLLELHLQLTKGEAVARLEGNWEADVAAFDEIFTEMLTLSDALADGIVHQFAEPFAA